MDFLVCYGLIPFDLWEVIYPCQNQFDDRPHPCLLPQEKENYRPTFKIRVTELAERLIGNINLPMVKSSPGGEYYPCWVLHRGQFRCLAPIFRPTENLVSPCLQALKCLAT